MFLLAPNPSFRRDCCRYVASLRLLNQPRCGCRLPWQNIDCRLRHKRRSVVAGEKKRIEASCLPPNAAERSTATAILSPGFAGHPGREKSGVVPPPLGRRRLYANCNCVAMVRGPKNAPGAFGRGFRAARIDQQRTAVRRGFALGSGRPAATTRSLYRKRGFRQVQLADRSWPGELAQNVNFSGTTQDHFRIAGDTARIPVSTRVSRPTLPSLPYPLENSLLPPTCQFRAPVGELKRRYQADGETRMIGAAFCFRIRSVV
jgi:hypothetical protein